jgi:hypothetical protein
MNTRGDFLLCASDGDVVGLLDDERISDVVLVCPPAIKQLRGQVTSRLKTCGR